MAVEVAYAKKDGTSIAYTVLGDGPVDVVFGAGLASHLDLLWGDPQAHAWFERLAVSHRVVLFDKPGTGLSDPVDSSPSVEERASDFLAVMNAAGSARAVIIGLSEAGPPAAWLAARHPERVEALLMLSTYARTTAAPDYFPEQHSRFELELWGPLWRATEHWGDGEFLRWLSPAFRQGIYGRLAPSIERASASPGMVRRIVRGMRDYDVRAELAAVRAPTLVLGRSHERIPEMLFHDIGERVPGARTEILPGDEHLCFFNGEDILDRVLQFLDSPTRARRRADRCLLTLVYTDIIGSTTAATQLGDQRWRAVLARHDELTAEETARRGGRVIKSLGDGALLAFDRPAQAVQCAVAVRERAADIGVALRAAVHTGECEMVDDDVAGITAHIASRLLGHANGDEIVVSGTVRDLTLGAGLPLVSKGSVELRDLPGRWEVLAVTDNDGSAHGQPATSSGARVTTGGETMTAFDRSMVAVARRAPRLSRALISALSGRGHG